jgi:molybdopterin-binding protein
MKAGARNNVVGTVKSIKKGSLMALVEVEIPNPSKVSSVMTIDSVKDMGLKEGDKVTVLVKAVNVLLIK